MHKKDITPTLFNFLVSCHKQLPAIISILAMAWLTLTLSLAIEVVSAEPTSPGLIATSIRSASKAFADPKLLSLRIVPEEPSLWGGKTSQQILVMGKFDDGLERDLTSQSKFTLSNPALVSINESGKLIALGDGEVQLRAEFGEQSASTRVQIEGSEEKRPFSFTRDIGGIITKHGCNTSKCHGSVKGRGGFKLSLIALDTKEDYEWITKGGTYQVLTMEVEGERIPRINLDEPENSLLLLKPSYEVKHGGGELWEAGSEEHSTILDWIRQDAPYETEGAEQYQIERVEIFPPQTILNSGENQQLLVTAILSNGRTEDLTEDVHYEMVNKEVAKVNSEGLIKAGKKGETTVIVRATGHAIGIRVGVIGDPIPDYPIIEERNLIDKHVFAKLRKFNIPPSGLSTDAEFLRRVCLDLTGTLPPANRVREFLSNTNPHKRDELIDILLDSPEYTYYWTYRFADIFRVSNFLQSGDKYAEMYWQWIRESILQNKPLDQIAKERIAAQGYDGPSRHYYHIGGEMPKPANEMAENVRVFMGRRLDCAQCHNHPYEAWTQDQFWGLAAFFGGLTRLGNLGNDMVIIDDSEGHGEYGQGEKLMHPRRKVVFEPRFLDGEPLPDDERHDPRLRLAEWMIHHPYFAQATTNRIWGYFFGRGLVDPVDDFRSTNIPTHPELLQQLGQEFRDNKYNLKHLMRLFCQSRTYQMSGIPNRLNEHDELNYSWARPRPLDAEVLFDAISQVTDAYGEFGTAHSQKRAINLIRPDFYPSRFLEVYGQADRLVIPERKNKSNLGQATHMLAGSTYTGKISKKGGRIDRLLAEGAADGDVIDEFYLAALSRFPVEEERSQLESMLNKRTDRKEAIEDMLWGTLTSREFAYNN